MCILPQIAQITQTNAAGLHYIAEKDSGEVLLFYMPWRDKDEDYLHWARRAM